MTQPYGGNSLYRQLQATPKRASAARSIANAHGLRPLGLIMLVRARKSYVKHVHAWFA
jgi:hypothetical protein